MPTRSVPGGYQWGQKGKIYGKKKDADKQGQAAYANGYDSSSEARREALAKRMKAQNG